MAVPSAPASRAAVAGLLGLMLVPGSVSATKLSRMRYAERRLVHNGFSPDYTSSSCRNDDPEKPSTLTVVQCCDSHFKWNPSCISSTSNWLMEQLYGEDYEGEKAAKYYPDPDGKGCLEDGPARPSWLASSLADDYGTCCARYKQWAERECLEADPALLADLIALYGEDNLPEVTQYWPDTTVGYCRPDSSDSPVARPNWVQTLEARFDECCHRHFKWNMEECMEMMPDSSSNLQGDDGGDNGVLVIGTVGSGGEGDGGGSESPTGGLALSPNGSPIEPPTAFPSKSPVMEIPEDLDCSILNRKKCLLFAPHCVFVRNFEDNSLSYCTAPYGDHTLDGISSEERCRVAGRAECDTIPNCLWHAAAGTCVFLSPPPPSPPADDAQGQTDVDSTSGTSGDSTADKGQEASCEDASFMAACTNIVGCRWKKRINRCIPDDDSTGGGGASGGDATGSQPSTGGSNTATPASDLQEAVDAACRYYPKEGCIRIPACQWKEMSQICTGAKMPNTGGVI